MGLFTYTILRLSSFTFSKKHFFERNDGTMCKKSLLLLSIYLVETREIHLRLWPKLSRRFYYQPNVTSSCLLRKLKIVNYQHLPQESNLIKESIKGVKLQKVSSILAFTYS